MQANEPPCAHAKLVFFAFLLATLGTIQRWCYAACPWPTTLSHAVALYSWSPATSEHTRYDATSSIANRRNIPNRQEMRTTSLSLWSHSWKLWTLSERKWVVSVAQYKYGVEWQHKPLFCRLFMRATATNLCPSKRLSSKVVRMVAVFTWRSRRWTLPHIPNPSHIL